MPKVRLHLDADTSIKALHRALVERGHDVTRTPTDWMPLDASALLPARLAANLDSVQPLVRR